MKKEILFASLSHWRCWYGSASAYGFGYACQRYGSEDPDPHPDQHVTDPEHWVVETCYYSLDLLELDISNVFPCPVWPLHGEISNLNGTECYVQVYEILSWICISIWVQVFGQIRSRVYMTKDTKGSKWAREERSPQRGFDIGRVQSCVLRLPKYWPPPPSIPGECVLPPHQRRGGHTRRAERGVGVNILEYARHRIGLFLTVIISLRVTWSNMGAL